MTKKILSLLLVLLFFLPQSALATDQMLKSDDPEAYYQALAETIVEHAQEDGSFAIMGDGDSRERFGREQIAVLNDRRLGLYLFNLLFHREDFRAVEQMVQTLNTVYLSSLFSGRYQLIPRACFTNDGIYQEANARTLYAMFTLPDAGVGMESYSFKIRITDVSFDGNDAKVLIDRQLSCRGDHYPKTGLDDESRLEGYYLRKIDGSWKVENIIFSGHSHTSYEEQVYGKMPLSLSDPYLLFEKTNDKDVWRHQFTFGASQRKNTRAEEDYTDFIEGDVGAPVFLFDKLVIEPAYSNAFAQNYYRP